MKKTLTQINLNEEKFELFNIKIHILFNIIIQFGYLFVIILLLLLILYLFIYYSIKPSELKLFNELLILKLLNYLLFYIKIPIYKLFSKQLKEDYFLFYFLIMFWQFKHKIKLKKYLYYIKIKNFIWSSYEFLCVLLLIYFEYDSLSFLFSVIPLKINFNNLFSIYIIITNIFIITISFIIHCEFFDLKIYFDSHNKDSYFYEYILFNVLFISLFLFLLDLQVIPREFFWEFSSIILLSISLLPKYIAFCFIIKNSTFIDRFEMYIILFWEIIATLYLYFFFMLFFILFIY